MNFTALFLALAISIPTAAGAQSDNGLPTPLTAKSFCSNLRMAFDGNLPAKSLKSGIELFVGNVKTGQVAEYVDISTLSGEPKPEKMWLSTADILVLGLGSLEGSALLIRDANELRYSNHVVKGSRIVLLTSEEFKLTEEQKALVIDALNANAARLYVVYTGPSTSSAHLRTIKNLAELTWATQGQIVVLPKSVTCSRLVK